MPHGMTVECRIKNLVVLFLMPADILRKINNNDEMYIRVILSQNRKEKSPTRTLFGQL